MEIAKEALTTTEQEWQEQLDTAAIFNSLGVPDPARPSAIIPVPGDRSLIAGFQLHGVGHRLDVVVQTPSSHDGVKAANVVGDAHFRFSLRLLVIPAKFQVYPGREPPPTALDTSQAQRFAIMDATFDFGGENRLMAIGSGQTFPVESPGDSGKISVAGLAGLLTSSGRFGSEPQGNLLLNGFVTPAGEFQLNVLLRIQDNDRSLLTDDLPPIQPVSNPMVATTSLAVHTAAWPSTTEITFSEDKLPTALQTWEQMMTIDTGFVTGGSCGPESAYSIGDPIGRHHVALTFLADPSSKGTVSSPFSANDKEEFLFHDAEGKLVGSISVSIVEIRSWNSTVPDVPAKIGIQVNGGFGPITGGQGCFAGISGTVINLGIGTLVPHLTSLIYVFQIADPTGRFRAD